MANTTLRATGINDFLVNSLGVAFGFFLFHGLARIFRNPYEIGKIQSLYLLSSARRSLLSKLILPTVILSVIGAVLILG